MARALRIWLLLAAIAGVVLLVALSIGSSPIAIGDVPRLLWTRDGSTAAQVLHELRLPRALAAFATGGLLALAGALMQVLLRNPLADPYVLGVSSGAAVGALGAMVLGFGALLVQLGAFLGALLSIVLVFAIAHRDLSALASAGASDTAPRLLLTGVMLGAGWTAVIALMLSLAPHTQLRGMLFWLAGDLAGAESAALPLLALAVLVIVAWPLARELNVMLRGAALAAALGVRIVPLRRALYVRRVARRCRRGNHRRQRRLHRPRRAARVAPADRQRPARAVAGLRTGGRHAAAARRHGGAHHRRTAAASGRRRHRAGRRADVPRAADAARSDAVSAKEGRGATSRRRLGAAICSGAAEAALR